MNSFQTLGLLAAAAFVAVTAAGIARHRVGRLGGFAWIVLWAAAGSAILYPQVTVWLARLLGIQRGADLVFYVAILGGLGGFYLVLSRLRRIERDLTLLTRRLALNEPASGPAADDGRPPSAEEAAG